ncbi:TetR/AcrR family transcriptional regulator [Amycolatopsis ultiminotia]|uniref:TetR/AcrR family transcriptional regulator n=1 Tax=Amycolatopsis ultiminotia TaxID=543629 RepID=A0ABP6UY66_9PSEU
MARRAGTRQTRGSILEEATRLFGAQGYTGTTMRDIANAVGLLPGSLYAHIDGKETLLLEIVEGGIDKFLALGYAAVAGPDSAESRLRQLIKGHVAIVAQNAERTLVVFHQWRYLTGENLARVVEKRRQYEAIITTVVEDGFRTGLFNDKLDLKTSVLSLLGALNWTAEWYKKDGPDTGEEIGERIADAILLGVRGR